MRISKTEVNLKRLLAAAPQQQNQAKLVHYVATLRELVEQLAEERTPEGLPRVSKAVLSDYSEKIEAIASKLAAPPPDIQTPEEPLARISVKANSSDTGDNQIPPSPGLRRRFVPISNTEDGTRETAGVDSSGPVKLDAAAQAHIEKHRKLQEDLTDEMVGLARQLKESSLMMSHSLENTEKILDSTEKAVESSLASTGHATTRAAGIWTFSAVAAMEGITKLTTGKLMALSKQEFVDCHTSGVEQGCEGGSSPIILLFVWTKSRLNACVYPIEICGARITLYMQRISERNMILSSS